MPSLNTWEAWAPLLLAFLGVPLLALLLLRLVHVALHRMVRAVQAPTLLAVLMAGRGPLRAAVALLAVAMALPAAGLDDAALAVADSVVSLAAAAMLGWSITRKVSAAFDAQLAALGVAEGDADLGLRQQRTRLSVFRRLAVGTAVLFTAGFVLTSIPAVRAVGLSLFASAGVAGVVIGIAARPTVSNLISGLQLALTQPIRIGDAVQIEGVWGRVHEITSTYVTVLTWDQRSLLVPLSWLLERPITNWTRDSAELLDTVFLYLDYAAPMEALRAEVARLVAEAPQWDGRTAKVQVTGWKESCIEVRVLLSAADAGKMWELRCLVREQLLAWLGREHPQALPRARQETVGKGG